MCETIYENKINKIADMCKEICEGRVLDLGCSEGYLAKYFKNIKYYGIDVNKKAIDIAKRKIKGKFIVRNLNKKLPFPNNFFDVIFCLDVLEHLSNPIKQIEEIKRVGKKNSFIIISLPNDYRLTNIFRMLINRPIVPKDHVWLEYTHLHFPTLNDSKKLFKKYFNIKK